jgi:nucleoside-diphosphate kinase
METTFLIVKPRALAEGHVGGIVTELERAGFEILGVASRRLTRDEAAGLYGVHEGKPFFEGLVEFMTSGLSVGLVLRAPGAVALLREVVGATDPGEAAPGTIRALYGTSVRENAVHAADSPDRVEFESSFYFGDCARTLDT